jgi:hypothetical protein
MALDAHVMPLWRFKAGDFSSPIEDAFGIKPDVISLAEASDSRVPLHQRLLAKFGIVREDSAVAKMLKRKVAKEDVKKLKLEISGMTGSQVEWLDEGINRYSGQYYEPVEMRAFAAWHEHRDELKAFKKPPEDNYYKHPVWAVPKPDARRFPTLIDHSLHKGYLLPVPFEGVFKVEPFMVHNHWKFYHYVASSQSMLRETTDFLSFLSEFEAFDKRIGKGVRLKQIHWYASELRTMCELSLEHRLPVIFHG